MRPLLLLRLVAALPASQVTSITTTTTKYDPTTYSDPNVLAHSSSVSALLPTNTPLARRSNFTLALHSNFTSLALPANSTSLALPANSTLAFPPITTPSAQSESFEPYKRSLPSTFSTRTTTNHTAPAPTTTRTPPILANAKRAPSPVVLVSVVTLPCCDPTPTPSIPVTKAKRTNCVACLTKTEIHSPFIATVDEVVDTFFEFSENVLHNHAEKRDLAIAGEDGLERLEGPDFSSEGSSLLSLPPYGEAEADHGLMPANSAAQPAHPLLRRHATIPERYNPLNAIFPGHNPLNPLLKAKPSDATLRAATHARNMLLYAEYYRTKLQLEVEAAQRNVDQQVSLGRPAVMEKQYLEKKKTALAGHEVRLRGLAVEAEKASVAGDGAVLGGSAGVTDEGFMGR